VTEFEPIVEGETLPLNMGPQGGYHVWLSFRAQGLRGERSLLSLAIRAEDPTLGVDTQVYVPLEDDPGADPPGAIFVGFPAQLTDPACFVGETIDLDVTLENESGRTAHGTQRVVVGPFAAGGLEPCAR
jgi:hypothetical protein